MAPVALALLAHSQQMMKLLRIQSQQNHMGFAAVVSYT
jgi:hypothetical protein